MTKFTLNWWTVGKWFIGLFFFFYLYRSFEGQRGVFFDAFLHFKFNFQSAVLIFFMICLVPINWGIEAIKWQLLTINAQKFSFFECLKAVLAGVTISLIVPNRMGEYIGRVAFLPSRLRVNGVLLTIIGSLAQTTTTVFMGIIAVTYFLLYEQMLAPLANRLVPLFSFGVASLWLYAYFNMNYFINLLIRIPFIGKFKVYFTALSVESKPQLGKLLAFSFFRYLVFSIQMMAAIWAFQIEIPIGNMITGVPLIFLAQSIVPGTILTDLGVRGSAIVFLFGKFGSHVHLLAAGLLVWVLNLVIPALLGYLFLVQQRNLSK